LPSEWGAWFSSLPPPKNQNKTKKKPDMWYMSIIPALESQAGASQVQGQPGLHNETLFKNKTKNHAMSPCAHIRPFYMRVLGQCTRSDSFDDILSMSCADNIRREGRFLRRPRLQPLPCIFQAAHLLPHCIPSAARPARGTQS
jgi:hypothetical protein